MYRNEPFVMITHENTEGVYKESLEFLKRNGQLLSKIADYIWAYHEIGDLIPQTVENFWSGHFFPYSEAYSHLEKSYQLCLQGFYSYSFFALRRTIELNTLYLLTAINDEEHKAVKSWFLSQEKTPFFSEMIKKITNLKYYEIFDNEFHFNDSIKKLTTELNNYIHTRGYFYSSSNLNRTNINAFSEKSLQTYIDFLKRIVNVCLLQLLLKYPIGLYPLPLDQKFGLNGPAGGYLQMHQTELIKSIIEKSELNFLMNITKDDPELISTIQHFYSLEDISEEEHERQIRDFNKKYFNKLS